MKEDLGEEGYEIIKNNSYEATSNYLEEKARKVKQEEKVITSNKSLDLEYFKETFGEDLISALQNELSESNKLTEEEINEIRQYEGGR